MTTGPVIVPVNKASAYPAGPVWPWARRASLAPGSARGTVLEKHKGQELPTPGPITTVRTGTVDLESLRAHTWLLPPA